MKSTQIFSCDICFYGWGLAIKNDFLGEINNSNAPDPKQTIPTFQSFKDYKDHYLKNHPREGNVCKEKSCLIYPRDYGNSEDHLDIHPHGDIRCKVCSLSFKFKEDHDDHMRFQHADLKSMSTLEIYHLFLEFENTFDICGYTDEE